MAHFVKVQFSIHDAKKPEIEENKKNKKSTTYRPRSARPKQISSSKASQTAATASQEPPIISFADFQQSSKSPGMGFHSGSPDSVNRKVGYEQRKQLGHSASQVPSTHHRMNPSSRIPTNVQGFTFSGKAPDRDLLRLEQDMKINGFRLRHPEIYEPPPDPPKAPHLNTATIHHSVDADNFLPRDRTVPKSSGANLNNPLPHYPFLKTNSDHGIHSTRWNVMTIPSDDPDRLRPDQTNRVTSSHADFVRFYKSSETVRPHTVARTDLSGDLL